MGNVYLASDELMHHGTKGMHWGVRKDPNSGRAPSKRQAKKAVKQTKKDNKKAAKVAATRKDIMGNPTKLYAHRKEFTDDELQGAIKSLKLEREVGQLSVDKVSLGGKYAKGALAGVTTAIAVYNTGQVIGKMAGRG